MAYILINGVDYSPFCNVLNVSTEANYNAQTNASGNTVVDYINSKRTIEVGIIPIDGETMATLQTALDGFSVQLSFRNPSTNAMENNITCIIPERDIEYYTIQAGKVMYNAVNLTFIEL